MVGGEMSITDFACTGNQAVGEGLCPSRAVSRGKIECTDANTHAPVGADDPVRPAVGTSVFLKPIGKFAIAQRADRDVRPYRTFYDFAENACNFAIASCAGGVEPRPYGNWG